MYSVVLMMAVTSGGETLDCHRGRSRGHCGPPPCYCYVVPPCPAPAPADTLTPEERAIFEKTIAEIDSFGEGSAELKKEVQDILNGGDSKAQKEWLDNYANADIEPAEKAAFDKSVATLEDKELRASENKRWADLSTAGKRYYLKFLGLASAQLSREPGEAPARLVVHLPASARLFVNDNEVMGTGTTRTYYTPNLERGFDYHYRLRVQLPGTDGQSVVQSQTVDVLAGRQSSVTFDFSTTHVDSGR
jgi:uncharacterized protein (TIGR03000 family)